MDRPDWQVGRWQVTSRLIRGGRARRSGCGVLAAVEPLTGQRLCQVRIQRPTCEYPQFGQQLTACYPQAEKIRLVQGNLTPHMP